jgi:Cys-rich repeat protein
MGRSNVVSVTVIPASCSVNTDCPEGYVCQSGVCVQVSPPPSIEPLKLVLVTLAVFGGGVGVYYGLKGGKKK